MSRFGEVRNRSVVPDFHGFYWVLLGFTGFHWIVLVFTEFYWVLPGST